VNRHSERAVKQARKRLAEEGYSPDALASLQDAERQLAAARHQAWAERLDLDVSWDSGAPLPHLLSNGSTAVLICRAAVVDPEWDGTYATVVSPGDRTPADMLEFTFSRCHAARIGGPNDEALNGHPLYGKGLAVYQPHLVHNSEWIRKQEAINSVHPMHKAGWHERLNHYFFVFHDEVFEALAQSVSVRPLRATMAECLTSAVVSMTED
jgi:hypothetical protein